jgi:hypothetical protein
MGRYARRTDSTHRGVIDGLRRRGYKVLDLSKCGYGVPDACVQILPGVGVFLEIKPDGPPSEQELSNAEKEWMKYNSWCTYVVDSCETALAAIADFKRDRYASRG